MNYTPGISVRLKATSELLYIENIDQETATAFCRRFGATGPEGEPEAFPLDALRENAKRIRAGQHEERPGNGLRRACCALGWHVWRVKTHVDRPVLGNIVAKTCRHCGIARMASDADSRRPLALKPASGRQEE